MNPKTVTAFLLILRTTPVSGYSKTRNGARACAHLRIRIIHDARRNHYSHKLEYRITGAQGQRLLELETVHVEDDWTDRVGQLIFREKCLCRRVIDLRRASSSAVERRSRQETPLARMAHTCTRHSLKSIFEPVACEIKAVDYEARWRS